MFRRFDLAVVGIAALVATATMAMAQAPAQTPAPQTAAPAEIAKSAKAAVNKGKKNAPSAEQAAAGDDGAPAAAPKKRDPAEVQKQVEAGIKLLQANKPDQAIQTLTYAIAGGGLPPQQMARALHNRGTAYRKTGKPAQAISDLTSALWLKGGLSEADRQDALKQRSEAYREAGLPDSTGEEGRTAAAAAPRTARAAASTATTTAGNAASPVSTASLAPNGSAPAQAASTGGLFSSLFGGIGKSQQASAAQPAPAPLAAAPTPATSGWSSAATTVRSAAPVAPAAVPQAAPAPAAAPAQKATSAAAAPAPGVHARIALVRNDQEAQAVVAKLNTNHAAAMAGKPATLSQAAFGGMGTFVQVRVGPYASLTEAETFCKKLKGSGLDCVPVDR